MWFFLFWGSGIGLVWGRMDVAPILAFPRRDGRRDCLVRIDSKKTLPLKQGYAVFFASFVAHRVLPVKKGNRISMVLWFGGPSLK